MPDTEATNSQLIDAVNLLCNHVEGRLADGWHITLCMAYDEAWLELTGPDGEEYESEACRFRSPINTMIDLSNE